MSPKTPIKILAALAISLFICACAQTPTQAAGTANVKDFGAVGDGITDDSAAIISAFNSDNDTIAIPEGEYRITRQIKFTKGNKTIIGEKATLFATVDEYTRPTGQYDTPAFVIIQGTSSQTIDDITFRGIRFSIRKGASANSPVARIVTIISANNIHFDSCTFTSDHELTNASITAIDLFANYNDVSITNSTIDMRSRYDRDDGGNVMIRSFWGMDVSNVVFANNTMYKDGPDEILWLAINGNEEWPTTTGSLSNVEISGNRLYIGDERGGSTYCFATLVEYTVGLTIKNVKFHNNEIIANSALGIIEIEAAENFDLYDNDIYGRITRAQNPTFSRLIATRDVREDSPITTDTVTVHDNRTLTIESQHTVRGLTSGPHPIHVYNNPRIVVNAPTSDSLIDNKGSFSNNNIIVNGNTSNGIIAENVSEVHNNNIYINGRSGVFFRNYNQDLTKSLNATGNTIATKSKGAYTATQGALLLRLQDFSMNGHTITIRGNHFINGTDIENDESLPAFTVPDMGSNTVTDRSTTANPQILWSVGLENAASIAPGDISFCNNVVQGFRTISRWANPPSEVVEVNLNCS